MGRFLQEDRVISGLTDWEHRMADTADLRKKKRKLESRRAKDLTPMRYEARVLHRKQLEEAEAAYAQSLTKLESEAVRLA